MTSVDRTEITSFQNATFLQDADILICTKNAMHNKWLNERKNYFNATYLTQDFDSCHKRAPNVNIHL